jgi:hypothetical protein
MTGLPVAVNLEAYHGDSWQQTFRLLDDTTPHDLTAATIASLARRTSDETTTSLTVTTANQGTNPGEFTLTAPAIETGFYIYDVQITEASVITTWIRGQLHVSGDITP